MPRMTGAALVAAVLLTLFAFPRDAAAGKAKSPFWAVVNADGDLVRGNGAVLVLGGGEGYLVFFERNVDDCAYTATTSDAWAGGTGTALIEGIQDAVNVFTIDTSTKALVPLPFHLMVTCPK